jgi:hypothetical protein
LSITANVFSLLFTLECILKIFAFGLVYGKNTYLKSGWNVLDFIIVISAIFEFVLDLVEIKGFNMRFLRTLRILRPLKAMKTVPSLRK